MSTSEPDEREKLVAYLREKAGSYRHKARYQVGPRRYNEDRATEFESWATLVEESVRVSEEDAVEFDTALDIAELQLDRAAVDAMLEPARQEALIRALRAVEKLHEALLAARARPTEAKESGHAGN
jgi:hypothetical protein